MTRLSVPEFVESTQEKIKKLKVEENNERRRKHAAVVKIQKLVRGWLTRRHLRRRRGQAITIQRYWRGYRGRLDAAALVERKYRRMVADHYHLMATRIQAMWRGYRARKTFDYYKQKAWLKSIMSANETTLKKMEEFRKSEVDRVKKEAADEFEPWIHYMANKLHHFLRTTSRPGIYSDPGTAEYSEIEKFLASYQYHGFMTDLRRQRLVEAVRELLSRPAVRQDGCSRNITEKRCVTALRARHTISNPCVNSTRK